MGDILSHTTTAGIAPRKAEIDAVTGIRLFIAFFRGFLDEQNAGELTVRARRGLERDSVHAEDLAKLSAQRVQRLERALRGLDALERVELGEARQRRHVLVDLGVVLHRARAEGIEAVVHAMDALAKGGVVTGELVFTHVGQVQRLVALFGKLIFGDVTLRHEGHAAAFDAKFKNELHFIAPPLR